MNNNMKYILGIVAIAILLAIGLSFLNTEEEKGPGKYDTLATCLQEKGVVFYGAFWCPHCREQKKIFGPSAKLLPYVECSTPDASGQLPACIDKKIEGYPTWEFPDGTRVARSMTPEELAEKTSCPLLAPQATTTLITN